MTIDEAVLIAERLLPEARLWVRKTAKNLDEEIQQTTAACLLDLKRVGIEKISEQDPLILQAAKLYLKAHFGFRDDSEKFRVSYESLRDALSLNSDYTEVDDDG